MTFGTLFYGTGSIFFIIVEKYESDSTMSSLSIYELIPSSLSLIIWFILSTNPFQVHQKVNEFLFEEFTYTKKNFKKNKEKRKSQEEDKIGLSMIARIFTDPNFSFKRKESYYTNSNANKLLNF